MICKKCAGGEHPACPELARQESVAGTVTALGGQLCECQHAGRRPSLEELLLTDEAAADDDVDEECGFCGGPLAQSPEPWCLGKDAHGLVIA